MRIHYSILFSPFYVSTGLSLGCLCLALFDTKPKFVLDPADPLLSL